MNEMCLKNMHVVKKNQISFYLFTAVIFSMRITCIALQKYQPPLFPNAYAFCILNKHPSDPTI